MGRLSFSQEPAMWIALSGAVLTLLIAFGVPLTPAEHAAIDGLVLALVGILTRSQVTPNPKPATSPE